VKHVRFHPEWNVVYVAVSSLLENLYTPLRRAKGKLVVRREALPILWKS
jgi:hypothetical protein